ARVLGQGIGRRAESQAFYSFAAAVAALFIAQAEYMQPCDDNTNEPPQQGVAGPAASLLIIRCGGSANCDS
ncbi:MAG TPA: hypothetical protein VHH91_11040, partial [Vicinamibacterales bacterium]|nr:hypothetical protein [Vicinamibacterales bacterium]